MEFNSILGSFLYESSPFPDSHISVGVVINSVKILGKWAYRVGICLKESLGLLAKD